jgi:hypothetical protein
MGALENTLMECDKEILVTQIKEHMRRIDDLLAANNALVARERSAAGEMRVWHELALTSARALAGVRAEINELAQSVTTIAHSSPAVRVVMMQRIFDRLTATIDGKEQGHR